MPAQKRLLENAGEDLQIKNGGEDEERKGEEVVEEENQLERDSDRSPTSSSGGEKEEFIVVKLLDVRKEVQCPICLGIIRKTRTVMECLHRFCRECIDKSMRMGNKECPACRTHCASRRSLRDDPNYDELIAALYPDIDQYEKEELAFQDEEDARNKQIQASIAQTLQRQSQASSKKRKRSRSTMRIRRRANNRSDDDHAKVNSSSADECLETIPRSCRRGRGQGSPSVADGGGHDENDSEVNRDTSAASGGLLGTPEMLTWGRGGTRSHTRHGSAGSGNSKQSRRIARLMEHLQNLKEDDEMDIQVALIPLDGDNTQRLQHTYLCCSPSLTVRQICQCITTETSLQADEIEILAVTDIFSKINGLMPSDVSSDAPILDLCKDELQLLDFELTLREVRSKFLITQGYMIFAYRRKCVQQGDHNAGTSTGPADELNQAGASAVLGGDPNQSDTSTAQGGE